MWRFGISWEYYVFIYVFHTTQGLYVNPVSITNNFNYGSDAIEVFVQ